MRGLKGGYRLNSGYITPYCLYQPSCSHHSLQIVSQYMQAHFDTHILFVLHSDMCRAHPHFNSTKRLLHGLSSHNRYLWIIVVPLQN
jgi:hypothetical protein